MTLAQLKERKLQARAARQHLAPPTSMEAVRKYLDIVEIEDEAEEKIEQIESRVLCPLTAEERG